MFSSQFVPGLAAFVAALVIFGAIITMTASADDSQVGNECVIDFWGAITSATSTEPSSEEWYYRGTASAVLAGPAAATLPQPSPVWVFPGKEASDTALEDIMFSVNYQFGVDPLELDWPFEGHVDIEVWEDDASSGSPPDDGPGTSPTGALPIVGECVPDGAFHDYSKTVTYSFAGGPDHLIQPPFDITIQWNWRSIMGSW